jgi:ATP-dependent DNA helicase RecG
LSKPERKDGIKTPVQFVKGVGPAIGRILGQRGIHTVEDLLFFFPRAYEDRRHFTTICDLLPDTTVTVAATVRSVRWAHG